MGRIFQLRHSTFACELVLHSVYNTHLCGLESIVGNQND